MAVIGFSEKEGWVVARWVLIQLFNDLKLLITLTIEMQNCLEEAIALDGLHLNLIDEHLRKDVKNSLKDVVDRISHDPTISSIKKYHKNGETLNLYLSALKDLKENYLMKN
jgi:hypothetical protein